MNSEQAKLLALTGQGEKITHLKGGVYEVVGFCVDEDFIKSDNFLDKPLVSFEEVEKIFPPNEYKMFVAVGYKNMRLRAKLYEKTVDKKYEHINYISSKAIIDESNIIGKNNAILHGVEIGRAHV